MTDPSQDLERGDTEERQERGPDAGMPRWVKVSLIIALAVAVLFLVGKLTGAGGDHGPGRHGGGDPPLTLVGEQGGHRAPGQDHGPAAPRP